MRGLAAELSGASDWMNVATAWLVGESGIKPYTLTTTKHIRSVSICFCFDNVKSSLHSTAKFFRFTVLV